MIIKRSLASVFDGRITAIVVFSFYFYKAKIIFAPVNFIFCTYLLMIIIIIIISINWLELDLFMFIIHMLIYIIIINIICICCAHIPKPQTWGIYLIWTTFNCIEQLKAKVYSKLGNVTFCFFFFDSVDIKNI